MYVEVYLACRYLTLVAMLTTTIAYNVTIKSDVRKRTLDHDTGYTHLQVTSLRATARLVIRTFTPYSAFLMRFSGLDYRRTGQCRISSDDLYAEGPFFR